MADSINAKKKSRSKNKQLYYKHVQPSRTEKNKTKKIVRHFKSNPEDMTAWGYLEAKGYKEGSIPLVSKGRKLKSRAAK